MNKQSDERIEYYAVEFEHGVGDDHEVAEMLRELQRRRRELAEARDTIEQQEKLLKAYRQKCSCHTCRTVRAALSEGDK